MVERPPKSLDHLTGQQTIAGCGECRNARVDIAAQSSQRARNFRRYSFASHACLDAVRVGEALHGDPVSAERTLHSWLDDGRRPSWYDEWRRHPERIGDGRDLRE